MLFHVGGVILLLAAAAVTGFSLCRMERERLARLHLILELVAHAEKKIRLFDTPYGKLFCDYPFPRQYAGTESENLAVLSDPSTEEGAMFASFLQKLGGDSREDTLRLCADVRETVSLCVKRAETEYNAQKKLYIAMPFLAAFSLILFLL